MIRCRGDRRSLIALVLPGIALVARDHLLRRGRQQAARVSNIAARFAGSRLAVHQVLHELLMVRFDASEARFGQALAMAREAMRPRPDDAGWVPAQRLELAWRAVEIANVLGRASDALARSMFADDPALWRPLLGQPYAPDLVQYIRPTPPPASITRCRSPR